MRVLVISDLHANLQATDAVLTDAARLGWDRALVLGDLVGYGADPRAVVDAVRALRHATVIRGNHDKVATGIDDATDFHALARQAVEWTAAELDADRHTYVHDLPQGPLTVEALGFTAAICHGSPFDEDYYVFDTDDAAHALDTLPETSLILYGHTHVQIGFRETRAAHRALITPLDAETIHLGDGVRHLINPGSVGQPRDGDSRAAYGIIDTETRVMHLLRVPYDIEEAQRRILAAGLHPHLADRLSAGR
ncbi:MAG: metallophosphatase family protein [Acidobacteriota bacterium]|nr:metallophosphatase family protein [Acidobacteriota bacterium]